jgi:RNA 3'-terminal phosphate cyclase (ATP)
MLEIYGASGEGGGQILRSSLTLSLLTSQPFHLRNIRARRAKPGLQPQHLMSVRAAATIGQAEIRGASLGSTDLVFEPGEVVPGNYTFAIGTAGATSLVLHTVYLPLALRTSTPSTLTLTGGTHVNASPCFHFLDVTWRAYLEHIGLRARVELRRPGFYPRGCGVVLAHIQPCERIRGLQLESCGEASQVRGISSVAGLPDSIAERQARRALRRLRETGLDAELREEHWDDGPGTVVTVVLNTSPAPTLFFGLGARGKPAERVADEAVEQLIEYLAVQPPAIDTHSADQLVLPLAFAEGPSRFRVAQVTRHLLTNISVIRSFVGREIRCDGDEGEPGIVRISD